MSSAKGSLPSRCLHNIKPRSTSPQLIASVVCSDVLLSFGHAFVFAFVVAGFRGPRQNHFIDLRLVSCRSVGVAVQPSQIICHCFK